MEAEAAKLERRKHRYPVAAHPAVREAGAGQHVAESERSLDELDLLAQHGESVKPCRCIARRVRDSWVEDSLHHAGEELGPLAPGSGSGRLGTRAGQRRDGGLESPRGVKTRTGDGELVRRVVLLACPGLAPRSQRGDPLVQACHVARQALGPLVETAHHSGLTRLVEPQGRVAGLGSSLAQTGRSEEVDDGSPREGAAGLWSETVRESKEHARTGGAVRKTASDRKARPFECGRRVLDVVAVRDDDGAVPCGRSTLPYRGEDFAGGLAHLRALVADRDHGQAGVVLLETEPVRRDVALAAHGPDGGDGIAVARGRRSLQPLLAETGRDGGGQRGRACRESLRGAPGQTRRRPRRRARGGAAPAPG